VNWPFEIFDHQLIHRLGWALLHSIWEGALLAALFALIQLGLRRGSANARYFSGCVCLLLLFCAPILSFIYLPNGLSPELPTARHYYLGMSSEQAAGSRVSRMKSEVTNSPASEYVHNISEVIEAKLPWLIQVWVLGVLALSLRWAYGSHWIRRLRTEYTEAMSPEWHATLRVLAGRLRIGRPVGLLVSSLVQVPAVVGWMRPVILLPSSVLTGLTPAQLEAILAHELAHVRRLDYLVNTFQILVETLLFYHPAVWWISHCIRQEREHCCDDLVVSVCGDRMTYVRALVSLEEARGIPNLAFAATGGSLLYRVRRLLGLVKAGNPPSPAEFGGMTLVAVGCIFALVAVWQYITPGTFQAVSLLRVPPASANQVSTASSPFAASDYYSYFLQTECLVIRSPVVLNRAIGFIQQSGSSDRAKDKLSNIDALMRLKKSVSPVHIPRTSLIEIRATAPEPNEAARMANAIAVAYKEYRGEQRKDAFSDSLHSLEKRFKEQEDSVRKMQQQVDRLRVELKVPDAAAGENMPPVLLSAESLRHIEGLRIESQTEYVRQKTVLEHLTQLDPKDRPATIQAIGIVDNQLSEYLSSWALVDQKLISLRKELGPGHIEVVKAAAQVEDLQRKINARSEGILRGLQAKLDSTGEGLKALSNAVLNAQDFDVELASRMRPYFEAKRDLEELVRFRQILTTKIAMEKTDQQLPPSDLVEIVEEAQPPTQPFASNRTREIALAGAGLGLILAGLLLTRINRFTFLSTKIA